MPVKAGVSLARLPGQTVSNAARHLRQQLQESTVTPEQLLQEQEARGEADTASFAHRTAVYATASLIIDQYWAYTQKQPLPPEVARVKELAREMSLEGRIRAFTLGYLVLLKGTQEGYVGDVKQRVTVDKQMSEEDQSFLAFGMLSRSRHGSEAVPMVSMADLVVMFGRAAEVAPSVFRRDIGRTPSTGELVAMLRRPHLMRLFVEMMSNGRDAVYPLFAMLEGETQPDLDDTSRTFKAECFEVREEQGGYSLRLREGLAAAYRSARPPTPPHRLRGEEPLGCPALYTGKFREMYEWICDGLEAWLAA